MSCNKSNECVDRNIIIIGSGMAGLYFAYKIKKIYKNSSFLILEKNKKQFIGGRANNDYFYGSKIVIGAGIGRKNKDKLLYKLLCDFGFDINEFTVNPNYSQSLQKEKVDINKIMSVLRNEYKNNYDIYNKEKLSFKQFSVKILGEDIYKKFILSSGYTDYENEDVLETLYHYGMEDNACCFTGFSVNWSELISRIYKFIEGDKNIKFSNNVTNIQRMDKNRFLVETNNGLKYSCNNVILATTIDSVKSLLPIQNSLNNNTNSIYNQINGQPFLRLYAKVSKKSIPVMKEYIKGYTIVKGVLQKIIPMDPDNGIYMIAYNDNKNTIKLKNYLENTKDNKEFYERLLEKTLNIPSNSISIISLKHYYWDIGTHYYKPFVGGIKKDFIYKAQHPETGIFVIGEMVSINQGWVEGALESVENILKSDLF